MGCLIVPSNFGEAREWKSVAQKGDIQQRGGSVFFRFGVTCQGIGGAALPMRFWRKFHANDTASSLSTAAPLPPVKACQDEGACPFGRRRAGCVAMAGISIRGGGVEREEASMNIARGQHAAALMDDGSVGVFGGINSSGFVQGSERYSDGAWVSIGSPGITGNVTEAVTLGTGHVLMRTDGSLNARLYDPVTNTWLAGDPDGAAFTAFHDLAAQWQGAGGRWQQPQLGQALTPKPARGCLPAAWRRPAARTPPCCCGTAAFWWFRASSGGAVAGAEIYDPDTGLWSVVAPPGAAYAPVASLVLVVVGEIAPVGRRDGHRSDGGRP